MDRAARYWSARHRAGTGGRHGLNTVLWREPGEWREVARHRLTDDAVWAYVVVALDRAGVGLGEDAPLLTLLTSFEPRPTGSPPTAEPVVTGRALEWSAPPDSG